MRTLKYKVGDIVELVDGVQYVYRGRNKEENAYIYDPVKPNEVSIFLTLKKKECAKYKYNFGAVPFAWKVDCEVIKRAETKTNKK